MVAANRASGIKPGAILAAKCVEAALKGEVPDHIVNPEVLPRWRQRFIRKALID
jgi:hypothetical protein